MNKIIKHMQDLLPDFIDEHFEKGVNKDRGKATVAICLFLLWYEKYEKQEKDARCKFCGDTKIIHPNGTGYHPFTPPDEEKVESRDEMCVCGHPKGVHQTSDYKDCLELRCKCTKFIPQMPPLRA